MKVYERIIKEVEYKLEDLYEDNTEVLAPLNVLNYFLHGFNNEELIELCREEKYALEFTPKAIRNFSSDCANSIIRLSEKQNFEFLNSEYLHDKPALFQTINFLKISLETIAINSILNENDVLINGYN